LGPQGEREHGAPLGTERSFFPEGPELARKGVGRPCKEEAPRPGTGKIWPLSGAGCQTIIVFPLGRKPFSPAIMKSFSQRRRCQQFFLLSLADQCCYLINNVAAGCPRGRLGPAAQYTQVVRGAAPLRKLNKTQRAGRREFNVNTEARWEPKAGPRPRESISGGQTLSFSARAPPAASRLPRPGGPPGLLHLVILIFREAPPDPINRPAGPRAVFGPCQRQDRKFCPHG